MGRGWSFSQRYLTAAFPLVVVGLASFVDRRPRLGVASVFVGVTWSVFLALNHVFGALQDDGATEVAGRVLGGDRSLGEFFDLVVAYSRLRYLL